MVAQDNQKTLDRIQPERLAECIAKLATAIDKGECRPTFDELRALAIVCDRNGNFAEAARVRSWFARS